MNKSTSTLIKNSILSLSLIFGGASAYAQPSDTTDAWKENAELICGSKYEATPNDFHKQRSQIRDLVSSSEHGKLVLDYAEENGAVICFDTPEVGRAGFFDFTSNALVLSDAEITLKTVKTASHEFRHKWQMDHDFSASTEYTPAHRALAGKVMEADAEAFANLVAFELEQQGHNVSGSFPDGYDYLPVYEAFQTAVQNGRTSHQAIRSAFDAWFELPIAATHYEYSYLDGFRRFIDDPRVHNHYPVSYGHQEISNEKLIGLGDLLDGENYFTTTDGIKVTQKQYISPLNDTNQDILDELSETIPAKQREFCATRPKEEQRFCTPYPTKKPQALGQK